jgi:hypothetical protein
MRIKVRERESSRPLRADTALEKQAADRTTDHHHSKLQALIHTRLAHLSKSQAEDQQSESEPHSEGL